MNSDEYDVSYFCHSDDTTRYTYFQFNVQLFRVSLIQLKYFSCFVFNEYSSTFMCRLLFVKNRETEVFEAVQSYVRVLFVKCNEIKIFEVVQSRHPFGSKLP